MILILDRVLYKEKFYGKLRRNSRRLFIILIIYFIVPWTTLVHYTGRDTTSLTRCHQKLGIEFGNLDPDLKG